MDLWAVEVVAREEGVPCLSAPVAFGHHHSVSNQKSFEFQSLVGNDGVDVLQDLVGEEGDVHSAVGLSGDPEVIVAELWEFLEPQGNGFEVVLGCLGIAVSVGGIIVDRKSNAWWALKEEHVGVVVPGERILGGREFICALVENMWSVFLQKS